MVLFVTQSFARLQGIPLLAFPARWYFGALFCQALWIPSWLQGTSTNQPPCGLCKSSRLGKSCEIENSCNHARLFFSGENAAKQGSTRLGRLHHLLASSRHDHPLRRPIRPIRLIRLAAVAASARTNTAIIAGHSMARMAIDASCGCVSLQSLLGDRAAALGNKIFGAA